MSKSRRRRTSVATIPTPEACTKRWTFLTKADAKRFIRKRRGTQNFHAKHVYQCPNGEHFHITSNPQDGSLPPDLGLKVSKSTPVPPGVHFSHEH